ncbi:2-hydroxyacid dehydrogenase [Sulfobacillus harzensis]|uniref:D-glycerate dehydrogenase n=1 Tax=Sulfobacillus harzensis TaxID=2729629 RepID=A0A7Y0L5W3_9FIRM|nr:D-glycerate dehydrogenase [Sulfobacillus harzensis]NMP23055.1 D-glycerate dehydrogenase [Sulfobacillus harzensis]
MSRIIVTRRIHADALEKLRALGELILWETDTPIDPNTLASWLQDADACLSMLTDRIGAQEFASAPRLKVVSNMAVGYDNIDLDAATRQGVVITNTPDVLTEATAELTWALMLALMRQLIPAREALLAGQWRHWKPDGFLGTELYGKTLGIVGWGRIGQAVARRAPAFGMRVVALNRQTTRTTESPGLPLEEFLAVADAVSIHVPLTPETRGLVNEQWFSLMKPGAFVINTARGPIIDEAALLAALNQGRIGGAALDVFHSEPADGSHPLASHPKVLATPHIGSATHETRRAMALRAVANIAAVLQGATPPDWVNRP